MVLAFKGTSAAFLGVGGNTASADKAMDNFMFSCCCGSISRLFAPSVCECASAENVLRCDAKCLAASVTSTDSYYHMAKVGAIFWMRNEFLLCRRTACREFTLISRAPFRRTRLFSRATVWGRR